MKRHWTVAALFALLVACSSPVGLPLGVFGILQVAEAEDLIAANADNADFTLLDVRTEEEYRAGHLDGAVCIDFLSDDFEERISQLPRERLYLIYCGSGMRSAEACERMRRLGFTRLYDMEGGFGAWDAAGCDWVCEDGAARDGASRSAEARADQGRGDETDDDLDDENDDENDDEREDERGDHQRGDRAIRE